MTADLYAVLGQPKKLTEKERILQIPRTVYQPENLPQEIIDYWTSVTRTPYGTFSLRPVQAFALHTLYHERGLLGSIGVGKGKTLIAMLAHFAFPWADPSRIMLILPATNRHSLVKEARKFGPHFQINRQLQVFSYRALSQPKTGPTLFKTVNPQVVICDEAHNLSDPANGSGCTNRVLLFVDEHPEVVWGMMSGTLFNRSVKDLAHLAEIALRERSPLPRSWTGLEDFSACLDVDRHGGSAQPWQWKDLDPLVQQFHPHPPAGGLMSLSVEERKKFAQEALYWRMRSTPGVVQTSKDDLGVALNLQPLTPTVPGDIQKMLDEVERDWCLPNGIDIDSPLEMYRVKRQISMGFYYQWAWPDGEPDTEWLKARKELNWATRQVISRYRGQGIDTPALVRQGIELARLKNEEIENRCVLWAEHAYNCDEPFDLESEIAKLKQERDDARHFTKALEWREYLHYYLNWIDDHEHKPVPPTEPVWFTDWFVDHAIARAQTGEPAALWYSHIAIADKLEQKGVQVIRPGQAPVAGPVEGQTVALSVQSHGTGHNLQGWRRFVLMCPPSSGKTMEQWLGRFHRPGQQADEVLAEIYAHTPAFAEAIFKAKRDAEFFERTNGQPQRILYGTWFESLAA